MPALRPRERRLLVLAGLLVIGVVGYVYVVEPLLETHAATRELVVARRGLLVRQERLVARADAYGRELETLQDGDRPAPRAAPDGGQGARGSVEIQKLVKTTAQEAGIEVRSERILATVERGGYAEVPVEVTLSGPVRGLTTFLHRLEDAPILLALTDLKVRAPATGAQRDLSATLQLSGFIPTQPGARPPGSSAARARPPPRRRCGPEPDQMARRLLLVVDGILLVAAVLPGGASLPGVDGAARPPLRPSRRPPLRRERPRTPPAVQARPPSRPTPPSPSGTSSARLGPRRRRSRPGRRPGRAAPAPPAPRPRLYGVVLLPEGRGRAYLEDVQRRRVVGYSVGDLVGDARLEQIKGDRVVLRRGGETFEVLLHDPSKPRQAAAPPGVQSPEAGGAGRPPAVRPPTGDAAAAGPRAPSPRAAADAHAPASGSPQAQTARSRTRRNDRDAGAPPHGDRRPRRPGRVRRPRTDQADASPTGRERPSRGDGDGASGGSGRSSRAARSPRRPGPWPSSPRPAPPAAPAPGPATTAQATPGSPDHAAGAPGSPDRAELRQRRHRGRDPGGQRDRRVQLHDRTGRRRQEGHGPDLGPDPGGRGLQRPPGRARGQRRDRHSLRQPLQDPADHGGPRAPVAHGHRRPGRSDAARRRADHPDRAAPARPGRQDRGHAPAVRPGRQPRRPGQPLDRDRHRRQHRAAPPDRERARRGGRARRHAAHHRAVRRRGRARTDPERVLLGPACPDADGHRPRPPRRPPRRGPARRAAPGGPVHRARATGETGRPSSWPTSARTR